jgi:hypothetical protein
MPRRCLSDVKHAAQGDRNDAVPSLGIGIQEIEPVTDRGRFEHDIEPAEFAHDGGNGRIDRHAVAYVESRRGAHPPNANPSSGSLGRPAVAVGADTAAPSRASASVAAPPMPPPAPATSPTLPATHAVLLLCRPP